MGKVRLDGDGRRRWRISRPLLAAFSLLILACNGSQRQPPATSGGNTVTVADTIDIEGVNEVISRATPQQTTLLYFALFLPLLDERPDYQTGPPTFAPRLAESYEFSEDRLQLTFHLRDDVTWSDGVAVTAEDVRWTWQAQTSPEIAWPFADSKERISDVEVVDPHTVRFHFTRAYATQLIDVNLGVILPKHAWSGLPFSEWRQNEPWFREHLVVDGPFTLESWEPQQRYVLQRNERYFEPGLPKLDRVVFEIIPDPASQLALLRSGLAHFVEFIAPADAAGLEAHPDLRLLTYLSRIFYFVQWNVARPLFADAEVRQALTMAIDRESMLESLHFGYANLSHSPFTSDIWAHNKGIEPWPYDPQRAREILAAHGWSDSDGDGVLDRDGQRFAFELMINAGNTLRRDIMVVIQEQLRQIGVEVGTRVMEFSALMAQLQGHDFDAIIFGIGMDTSLNTYHFFHSRAIDDGFNWGGYSNPAVDRVIEEIEDQVDQLEAKPLYYRLQELLHEDLPYTFLYEQQRIGCANEALQDVDPNSVSTFYNLRRWRLVEKP
jgi:peptide/nickel transport system substrate-binding protein